MAELPSEFLETFSTIMDYVFGQLRIVRVSREFWGFERGKLRKLKLTKRFSLYIAP